MKLFNWKKNGLGNSLVVQWLGLHASTAGGMDSIPSRGTKFPQVSGPSQKKKNGLPSGLDEAKGKVGCRHKGEGKQWQRHMGGDWRQTEILRREKEVEKDGWIRWEDEVLGFSTEVNKTGLDFMELYKILPSGELGKVQNSEMYKIL